MKRQVITANQIEGFHNWPDAPSEFIYLAARHRHMFHVRCWWEISHNNREIEINNAQQIIERDLNIAFGKPCEFQGMSCEDICEHLLSSYPQIEKVEVTEDGYGGASLTR